jgi:hypothetical protein
MLQKDDPKTEEKIQSITGKRTGITEFIDYVKSPWKVLWVNLLAGIARGVGIVIGMTIVIAFILWLLGKFVDFPLIGTYFQDLKETIEKFSEIKNIP